MLDICFKWSTSGPATTFVVVVAVAVAVVVVVVVADVVVVFVVATGAVPSTVWTFLILESEIKLGTVNV